MKLHTYINFKRFLKTLKYDLLLHGKIYLYALAALPLVLFLYNYYHINNTSSFGSIDVNNVIEYYRYSEGEFRNNLGFMFFCSWVIVVGTAFPMLRKKQTTCNYLLLPASILEKFLTQLSIRFLVFPLLFILLYWVTFKLAVHVYFMFEHFREVRVEVFTFSEAIPKIFLNIEMIVFGGISFFAFTGAAYFNKYAIFKTIITFLLISFTYYLFAVAFSYIFIPNWVHGFEPNFFERKIIDDTSNINFVGSGLFVFSSLFLVFLAYFKLKEKEI